MIKGNILYKDLNLEVKTFLQNDNNYCDDKVNGIPLYFKKGGNIFLINDFLLSKITDNFAENAYKIGVYRLGAGIAIKTAFGFVCAYDERYEWDKPIPVGLGQGLAEGKNPKLTAIREFCEEVFVTNIGDPKNRTRFCPTDILQTATHISKKSTAMNLTVKSISYWGTLDFLSNVINQKNSAYEEWFLWDISTLENYTILLQEESWMGGNTCIPVLTRHQGIRTGYFSGQQGWTPIIPNTANNHPAWMNLEGVLISN